MMYQRHYIPYICRPYMYFRNNANIVFFSRKFLITFLKTDWIKVQISQNLLNVWLHQYSFLYFCIAGSRKLVLEILYSISNFRQAFDGHNVWLIRSLDMWYASYFSLNTSIHLRSFSYTQSIGIPNNIAFCEPRSQPLRFLLHSFRAKLMTCPRRPLNTSYV